MTKITWVVSKTESVCVSILRKEWLSDNCEIKCFYGLADDCCCGGGGGGGGVDGGDGSGGDGGSGGRKH